MLLTIIFSESPITPALKQQIPLIIKIIFTPYLLALYKEFISSSSTNELHLNHMPASIPFFAFSIGQGV